MSTFMAIGAAWFTLMAIIYVATAAKELEQGHNKRFALWLIGALTALLLAEALR